MPARPPDRLASGCVFVPRAAALPTLAALGGCMPGDDGGAFAAVALVAVGAAGYAVGLLRERRAAEAALRAARAERRDAVSLLDGWVWQSDASHRLVAIQPPAGAVDDAARPLPGGALWEQFETPKPALDGGLRARLGTQRAFASLRVRLLADDSVWRLRAAPGHDDLGRFAGYSGTAEPVGALDALAADHGALQALLQALDTPVLLAAGDGDAARWTLRGCNAAARRWLETETAGWGDVLARLPAAVREAVAGAGPDTALEVDGWVLRRFDAGAGAGLLLTQAARADGGDDGAAFGFTVTHDLRAPIRVVEGFTRILKEDYGRLLDRIGNEHLDRVLGAAARMNQMIDSMLALAKLSQQPLSRQSVNLSQLAGWVVDDLRRAAPERRTEIDIEPGLQTRGDPTLLRLVLENLLGNAWKYSARANTARIAFGCEPHEGRRAFFVRDNGAGFDMRSADRLFGLFQRLHSASDFPGNGVGLASVRRIVRRHGGEVWAEAEPGRGATFRFTLRE